MFRVRVSLKDKFEHDARLYSEGYKYILTMMDNFTKWIETRTLRSKEAKEVAKGIFSFTVDREHLYKLFVITGLSSQTKFPKACMMPMIVS